MMKKKLLAVLFVALTMLSAPSAHATCLKGEEPDPSKSTVTVVNDDWMAKAVVIVTLRDYAGNAICEGLTSVSTDRNQPNTGWQPNVDKVTAIHDGWSDEDGRAVFLIETQEPAMANLYIFSEGVELGVPGGLPLIYTVGHTDEAPDAK